MFFLEKKMDILQSNLKREKPYRGKQEDKRSLATVCKIMEGIEKKFDLYPQTYFIAVNIMDKLLQQNRKLFLSKSNFFLAYSFMFLASKFEDVYSLQIHEVLHENKVHTKQDFICFERQILKELGYIIPHITSYSFLIQYLGMIPELNSRPIYEKCVEKLRKPQTVRPSQHARNVLSVVIGKENPALENLKEIV